MSLRNSLCRDISIAKTQKNSIYVIKNGRSLWIKLKSLPKDTFSPFLNGTLLRVNYYGGRP